MQKRPTKHLARGPTTTHTDKKPWELCKAIESPGYEALAYALVGRLWEMGVERSGRAARR